jgi:nicotinamide N-methyltransferase
MSDDYEDILKDSLEFLGGKPVIDDEAIKYGPLVLTVAPKVWMASFLTLHPR